MKKVTKYLLIIGGIIFSLGLLLNIIVLAANGFNPEKAYDIAINTHEFKANGEIKNLNIDVVEADVNILNEEGSNVRIEFKDSNNIYHKADVNGNTLSIKRINRFGWLKIFVPSFIAKMSINIYLPDALIDSLDIKLASGDLSFNSNLNSTKADISNVSGDVIVNNLKANLSIKTVSGDIELNNVSGDRLLLKSTSGDVEASNLIFNETNIKTVSGDISASGDFKEGLRGESVGGDIFMGIKKSMKIDTNTVSGRVEKPSEGIAGAPLFAKTVSGNITIKLI